MRPTVGRTVRPRIPETWGLLTGAPGGIDRRPGEVAHPQPRQHPDACARPFGAFYIDMCRMNEMINETMQPYGAMTGLMYWLVRGGGGSEIRTPEELPPTRFPTMRLSVHARPGPSVTWDDRGHWVPADARELGRMRLRMRLRLKRPD